MNGLPADAAVWRDRDGGWTQTDHLLAAVLENADFWGRQGAVLQGVPKSKLPKAVQVTRPGQEQPSNVVSIDAFAAMVNQQGRG